MPAKPKVKKLLKKVRSFLDDDYKDQLKRADSMKSVLDKLKKRQKALEREMGDSGGNRQAKLADQIRIVKAQRKKGIKALKELREKS